MYHWQIKSNMLEDTFNNNSLIDTAFRELYINNENSRLNTCEI
jgi:hypothetical protein